MKKNLIALALAALATSAFAGTAEIQAVMAKSISTCEAAINKTQSVTLQKAAEFECHSQASQKRDIATYVPKLQATLKAPVNEKALNALFDNTSLRGAYVQNGSILRQTYFPDGLDVAALAGEAGKTGMATKTWTIVRPGYELPYFAIAVVGADGAVLVGAVPQDGSALSGIRYAKLADDETKRAAGKAAKAAAAEAAK